VLKGDGVIAAVAGLLAGYLAQAVLVALGLGAVLARNPTALRLITFLGAGYLLTLGIAVLRRLAQISARDQATESPIRHGLRGAAVSD
jgi:threonine/homoserine/homoserine lactone efflux protein